MEATWTTVTAAQKQCQLKPECRGITFDTSTRTGENFFIYLKTVSAFSPGPGTSWKTMVEEQRPELHGSAAVAGPLTQVSSDSAGTFRLDLHKAAPQLFPAGSIEQFSVSREELQVQRRVAGTKMLSGIGVRAK